MSLSDANEIVDSTMSSGSSLSTENETFLIEYAAVFVRRTRYYKYSKVISFLAARPPPHFNGMVTLIIAAPLYSISLNQSSAG